jgi:hypothetical protein
MISCTEFIPAYSELFSYLEEKHGRNEVDTFWNYLFAPNDTGIPLIRHMREQGLAGCFSYWGGTLNEEAADFTMYLNEKAGWFLIKMHRCPSKGRLLDMKHITPYHDYCLHCDLYRKTVTEFGLEYIYDFTDTDHAACRLLIYDPDRFDGRLIADSDTQVMDRRDSANRYFHKDFHNSLNMGLEYLGTKYGADAVKEYLERFTKNFYSPLIAKIKKYGLSALKEQIRHTYEEEGAGGSVRTQMQDGTLTVIVTDCPRSGTCTTQGGRYRHGIRILPETVMQTLADQTGYSFQMLSYDKKTGSARYQFGSRK